MAADRGRLDALTQINAVRAAFLKNRQMILRNRLSHCVVGACVAGDVIEQRNGIEELVATVGR